MARLTRHQLSTALYSAMGCVLNLSIYPTVRLTVDLVYPDQVRRNQSHVPTFSLLYGTWRGARA